MNLHFKHVHTVAKRTYYLRHVCLSVCLCVYLSTCINAASTRWIFMKCDIGKFYINLLRKSKFISNRTNYQALFTKTKVCFIVAGDSESV